MSSVDESSAAADGASSDAGAEKGGKSKKKIRFPPGFKLIRLLKRMEKQVETNPRPDYLAKIAELKEGIQRKRDEKRRHVAKKMLKKQRVFLLRSFIKKVKEFRYKIENAAADLPENVLTERKRLLQKYTEELEIVKALDLDTLVTEAMDAVQNKPAEPTTREDRIKHRLILNPDVQKYLRYKPGSSDASAMTAEDLDTDSASEDSQGRGKKRRSEGDAGDDDDNDPFFGSANKAEEADEADPEKEVAYARQSLFLDSLAQKPKKKTIKKKKEPYKPKNRPGQRARQALREGTNPARSGPGGPRPPFRPNRDGGGGGGGGGAYPRPDKARADKPRFEERSNLPSKITKPPRPASKSYAAAAAAAETGSLHPSWEAKRQAELQRQVTSFQGTKIKFDD